MQAGVSALPLTTLLAGLVLAQFDARMPFAIVGVKRGIRAEIDDVWWLLPQAIVIETFQAYCPGRCPVFLPAPCGNCIVLLVGCPSLAGRGCCGRRSISEFSRCGKTTDRQEGESSTD